MALSWPFGAAILRDVMLPWVREKSGCSPARFVEPSEDSDSSEVSLGDLEEADLPVERHGTVRLFALPLSRLVLHFVVTIPDH
jgi:hypothetical protein